MPTSKDKKNNKKKSDKSGAAVSANETLVHSGGKKDNRGISHPSKDALASAANFVKENKL